MKKSTIIYIALAAIVLLGATIFFFKGRAVGRMGPAPMIDAGETPPTTPKAPAPPSSLTNYSAKTPKELAPHPGYATAPAPKAPPAHPEEKPIAITADSVPPATNELSPFDAVFSKLGTAHLAFQVKTKMGYGETQEAALLLSEILSTAELAQHLHGTNIVSTNTIKVADIMEAHLSGDGFDITAITPETQPISGQATTKWKWDLTPKDFGKLPLHLAINAKVTVDGQELTRTIRTFDETVYVEVTCWSAVRMFVRGNWQWLWTTLIVPIGAWVWHRKRKAKKKKKAHR